MGLGMLIKELDLTDTQKKSIAEVLTKYRDTMKAMADQRTTAHEELRDAIIADPMIETDVRQASQELASVMEEMNVLKAQVASEIRPLLTAEQIEQVKTKRSERQARMEERREEMSTRIDKVLEDWLALEVE